MASQQVTTTWARTYSRDKIEYRPEGGWDGNSACHAEANPPSHPTDSFGGQDTDYCFNNTSHCTAVSQPNTPPVSYDPTSLTEYTDSSKSSSPVCPYHPVHNPGTPAERMVHCEGDGYQSTPPGNWIDGATGSWGSSSQTTPVTWKYTARYRRCRGTSSLMWKYIQGLTVSLAHPLEERSTAQTKTEGRTQSCSVDCYP